MHSAQVRRNSCAFTGGIRGDGPVPITIKELAAATEATFATEEGIAVPHRDRSEPVPEIEDAHAVPDDNAIAASIGSPWR
ncbi:MAG: hypothetical protein WBX25_20365 [Rhodomicrobium sp.]